MILGPIWESSCQCLAISMCLFDFNLSQNNVFSMLELRVLSRKWTLFKSASLSLDGVGTVVWVYNYNGLNL